jgi:hypothetical protein
MSVKAEMKYTAKCTFRPVRRKSVPSTATTTGALASTSQPITRLTTTSPTWSGLQRVLVKNRRAQL